MVNIETKLNFYPRNQFLEEQITRYFDLNAEKLFLENLKKSGVDRSQIRFYSQEQLLKFLLEFATGVKKTEITYQINSEGQVVYPRVGLIMEEVLWEAAQSQSFQGNNHRELAEFQGWQKMQQLFRQKDVKSVLQLSPPDRTNSQHGDYGFLFWFQREGDRVVNHLLRYQENNKQLTQSRFLADRLGISISGSDNLANSYLLNPVGVIAEAINVEIGIKNLGLTIDRSGDLLEQALLADKSFLVLLFRYEQLLSSTDWNGFVRSQASQTLSQLYQIVQERALQIGLLDKPYRQKFLPLIYLGGSCPIIGAGVSYRDFAGYLSGEPFECPNCHCKSYTPVGNQCPNCRITKQEWKRKLEQQKEQMPWEDSAEICE